MRTTSLVAMVVVAITLISVAFVALGTSWATTSMFGSHEISDFSAEGRELHRVAKNPMLTTETTNTSSELLPPPIVQEMTYDEGRAEVFWDVVDGEGDTGEWWDPAWGYRVPIIITEQSGSTLVDYQVLVEVDTASLIAVNKLRSDAGDLRFTTLEGIELPYWIEFGINTSSTKVWVKIPSIPANGTTTIHMYYDNPSATSAENGTATFEFFDDFLTDTWTDTRGGWAATTFDGKTVLQSGAEPWNYSYTMNQNTSKYIGDVGSNWAVELYTYWDSPSGSYGRYWSVILTDQGGDTPTCSGYLGLSSELHWGFANEHRIMRRRYPDPWEYYWAIASGAPNKNTWARQTLKKFGGNISYSDAITVSGTDPLPLTTFAFLDFHHNTEGAGAAGKLNVDWILVRKYVEPEPTAELGVDTMSPVSSVVPISPYWQNASTVPFTITATASDDLSGVASVELFYRYSSDNVTFSPWTSFGVDTVTPWEWSFTAAEGDGYYEFYSVATDAAGNVENAPSGRQLLFEDDFDYLNENVWWVNFSHSGGRYWNPSYGRAYVGNSVLYMRPSYRRGGTLLETRDLVVTSLPATVKFRIRFEGGGYYYRAAMFALDSMFEENGRIGTVPYIMWRLSTTHHLYTERQFVTLFYGPDNYVQSSEVWKVIPVDTWLEGEMRLYRDRVETSFNGVDLVVYGDVESIMNFSDGLNVNFQTWDDYARKGFDLDWIKVYGVGGVADATCGVVAPAVVPATIDIDPDTLNLKSQGNWITCYIELPEGHDVRDIDISTVMLEDIVPAEPMPTEIGDHDHDGIPDLMVKFDRAAVQDLVSVGDVELTVTGLVGEVPFEGSDVIRVIDPGEERPEAPHEIDTSGTGETGDTAAPGNSDWGHSHKNGKGGDKKRT